MTIITRFAPSPTGYLHIGGARTALFNYLFAKHHGGKFFLRIEDTDIARSTDSAKNTILSSLKWLNIEYDGEVIYQSERALRHVEVAEDLVAKGKAYYCYTQQEEINDMRQKSIEKGEHFIFHSPWRDANRDQRPQNVKPVIRLKAPREGESVINDLVQGKIVVQNSHLDDMILLRSDSTPTYMLAVVVDDHDMGVTHIIRGDDHLNNAFRQKIIYEHMEWNIPEMAHIPLIHGSDGAKLSKRHGALGVEEYKNMGYLPDALNNYLLRLGWAHGNDEVISRTQAIDWFDVGSIGKSPARLDFDKMKHMNAIYLRQMDNYELANLVFENLGYKISEESKKYILSAMDSLKLRSDLITDLCDMASMFVVDEPIEISKEARELIEKADRNLISEVINNLQKIDSFKKDEIQAALKEIAANNGIKIGELMQYVRPFIAGRVTSPSIFEMMEILGKKHSLERLS